MSVSTTSASASMPAVAVASRRLPSKPNGFVTMPTVSAPSSRLMRATTGAAPVPVPPPAPAATKTMSEPLRWALMRSCSSIAAWRPRSGSAPAPRPRVTCGPMWIVTSALDCCSDCRSVLIPTKSTPSTSASIMRSTALTPAPPTPTTRMTGPLCERAWPQVSSSPTPRAPCASAPGRLGGGGAGRSRMSSGRSALKAWRRRSCGVGTRRAGSSGASPAPSPGCG